MFFRTSEKNQKCEFYDLKFWGQKVNLPTVNFGFPPPFLPHKNWRSSKKIFISRKLQENREIKILLGHPWFFFKVIHILWCKFDQIFTVFLGSKPESLPVVIEMSLQEIFALIHSQRLKIS